MLSWSTKIARLRVETLSSGVTRYNYMNRGWDGQSGRKSLKCNFFFDFSRTGVNNRPTHGVLWAEGDFPEIC